MVFLNIDYILTESAFHQCSISLQNCGWGGLDGSQASEGGWLALVRRPGRKVAKDTLVNPAAPATPASHTSNADHPITATSARQPPESPFQAIQ